MNGIPVLTLHSFFCIMEINVRLIISSKTILESGYYTKTFPPEVLLMDLLVTRKMLKVEIVSETELGAKIRTRSSSASVVICGDFTSLHVHTVLYPCQSLSHHNILSSVTSFQQLLLVSSPGDWTCIYLFTLDPL